LAARGACLPGVEGLAVSALLLPGAALAFAEQPPQTQPPQALHQSANRSLEAPSADDTQWPMATKNYANTRFSSFDQINTQNAGQLKIVWTCSLGADRGQEAAPLVLDGKMYVVSPYAGAYWNRSSRLTRPMAK
jgi:lanthanide-dependent methanol dehydrogenase